MPRVSNNQAGVAIYLADGAMAKFDASLDRYLSSVNVGRSKVVRKIGGGMLGDMSLLSPVRKGRFRAGWRAGFRALGQRPPAIPRTSVDIDEHGKPVIVKTSAIEIAKGDAEGSASFVDDNDKTELSVRNGVRYGPYIEAGASRQAPRGVVRVTVDRYRRFLDDNMRRIPVQGAK